MCKELPRLHNPGSYQKEAHLRLRCNNLHLR